MSICKTNTTNGSRGKRVVHGAVSFVLGLTVVGCHDDDPAHSTADVISPVAIAPIHAQRAPDKQPGWIGVVVPQATVDIVARTDGRLESIDVRPGDTVIRGQVLARVDSSGLDQEVRMADADLEVARAEHQRAIAEADREQERHARREAAAGAVSREERESAAADARAAAALRDAAAAHITQRQARVEDLRRRRSEVALRAPFDGRVAVRYLDAGALVADGAPVLRLVHDGALAIRFAVPPTEAGDLANGMEVTVRDDGDREVTRATVAQIAPEIDIASQMLFAEAIPVATPRDAVATTAARAGSLRAGGGVWVRRARAVNE